MAIRNALITTAATLALGLAVPAFAQSTGTETRPTAGATTGTTAAGNSSGAWGPTGQTTDAHGHSTKAGTQSGTTSSTDTRDTGNRAANASDTARSHASDNSAVAAAGDFAMFDSDRDGSVTRTEFTAVFARLDANRDGRLSRTELDALGGTAMDRTR
ncbi:MAG TPA: hypothetical protein VFE72_12840 [Lysobacter sp.]|nr:hypothetical protein [Lysobacter sp.]